MYAVASGPVNLDRFLVFASSAGFSRSIEHAGHRPFLTRNYIRVVFVAAAIYIRR